MESKLIDPIPSLNLDSVPETESSLWQRFSWISSMQSLRDFLQYLYGLLPVTVYPNQGTGLWDVLWIRINISISRPFVNFNRLLNSEAYWYPLKGIHFFYQHPELWSSLQVIPPHLALSFTVYCCVWSTFFPLQFVIATIFGGPMGIIIASIATLQQCHYYSSFVTNKLLLPEQLDSVFDATLIATENYDVVLRGKLRRITPVPFVTKFRRFMWSIPTEFLFYPIDTARMVIPTVYNSVPMLGPLIYSMTNASLCGIKYQQRYFNLKNLKPGQVQMLNKKRMGHYASFGFVASILELTPILGFVFEITNTVGAALWCADLENELNAIENYSADRTDTIRGLIKIMP